MDEAPLNDLWKFNLKSQTWTGRPIVLTYSPHSLADAPFVCSPHPSPSAVKAKGGKPPSPRSFHKMIAINQVLFVFGGCSAKDRLADLHQFDTRTNTWTEVIPIILAGQCTMMS